MGTLPSSVLPVERGLKPRGKKRSARGVNRGRFEQVNSLNSGLRTQDSGLHPAADQQQCRDATDDQRIGRGLGNGRETKGGDPGGEIRAL